MHHRRSKDDKSDAQQALQLFREHLPAAFELYWEARMAEATELAEMRTVQGASLDALMRWTGERRQERGERGRGCRAWGAYRWGPRDEWLACVYTHENWDAS